MAVKYKLSEVGIQKIIEVLNDGVVIGKSKYGPKELTVSDSNGTVQITEALSGKVVCAGTASSFVNSSNQEFGQNATAVVSAITQIAERVNINIAELEGLDLVDNQLLPDLSAYAKIEDIQTLAVEGVSAIEETIANNLEKHIAYTAVFPTWVTQIDTTLSYPEITATFTVPANGKVQVVIPLNVGLTQAGTFYGLINKADPGVNGQVFEGDDDRTQFRNYLDSIGHPSTGYGDLYSDMGVRMIACRFPIPEASAFPMQTSTLISQEITGLTPGAEETIYFWIMAGAVHFNCEATFNFTNGIKVFKVND
jgi:hypothetical protein